MTSKRSKNDDRRELVIETIEDAFTEAKVHDFIKRPSIPEVLVNPCFLTVPVSGSLLVVDVQDLPSDPQLWDFTLENIEGLIEIKASTGFQTTVAIFLLDWENTKWKVDAIRLLEVMFDHVFIFPANDPELIESLKRKTNELLENPKSNNNLISFWKSELEQRQSNHNRIMKSTTVRDLLRQQKKIPPILLEKRRSKKEVLQKISQIPELYVKTNQKVFNIKEFLLNTPTHYYFYFDYSVFPQRLTSNFGNRDYLDSSALEDLFASGGFLSELFHGSDKKYLNMSKLRKLATYARFISYRPGFQGQPLVPLQHSPNLNLIVDGNLIGPEFAPDRYIDMLVSTGWNLVRVEDLDQRAFNVGVRQ